MPKMYSSERLKYKTIKSSIIYATAKQENITIGKTFIEYHNKYYFKYADRRDGLLIRFFCNYGFFNPRSFPSCLYCKSNNSRTHVVNECKENFFEDLRQKYLDKIKSINGRKYVNIHQNNLENIILDLFFDDPKDNVPKTLIFLKEFVTEFYIERSKVNNEDYLID